MGGVNRIQTIFGFFLIFTRPLLTDQSKMRKLTHVWMKLSNKAIDTIVRYRSS